MERTIKTQRTAKGTGFTDRVRFNWGYHDAAAEARHGSPRVCCDKGEQSPTRVSREWDAAYHDGYVAGLADARKAEYQGDSTRAWDRRSLPICPGCGERAEIGQHTGCCDACADAAYDAAMGPC